MRNIIIPLLLVFFCGGCAMLSLWARSKRPFNGPAVFETSVD